MIGRRLRVRLSLIVTLASLVAALSTVASSSAKSADWHVVCFKALNRCYWVYTQNPVQSLPWETLENLRAQLRQGDARPLPPTYKPPPRVEWK
jgi:hypothetical protein